MQPFDLISPTGVAEAIELGAAPGAAYLAGARTWSTSCVPVG
jgi:CO/xanthine dehydrogenase FAD-binding subunit